MMRNIIPAIFIAAALLVWSATQAFVAQTYQHPGLNSCLSGIQTDSSGNLSCMVSVIIPKLTVGSLPTCNSGAEGMLYGVTDALTPAALATVVGGGAVHALVYCNGTNWVVG